MDFRIADTFTDSLARLTGDEQKAVKTTAFDLQLNPANPGMSFHKLDKAKDKNFWSVRVTGDIRLIVHKSEQSLLLCYVDHHDRAYDWAERRKLEAHPKTGAAQFVEIRETVKEVVVPKYVEKPLQKPLKPALFVGIPDHQLLSYGVPREWLADVRQANEDSLLALADHLPGEASEALLELATGGQPPTPQLLAQEAKVFTFAGMPPLDVVMASVIPEKFRKPTPPGKSSFDHPDAQRRFRVMTNVEELRRALEFPWDRWAVFLHPQQRQSVEGNYSGPARVSGSAGTGKTIVALHRAVFLARKNPDARVLLTTFSDVLANALRTKLKRLISDEPRLAERLEVDSIDAVGQRLFKGRFGQPQIISRDHLAEFLKQASAEVPAHKFSLHFLTTEWEQVVDAWQLDSWEAYRDVRRLGRKTRLPEQQRAILWSIFDRVRTRLSSEKLITYPGLFSRLAAVLAESRNPPFDFAVVDESQDISVSQLRFLAALGASRPNGLFFAGDLGQRIFQQPFSWLALGVDIRGRARTLHVNYRTSHQIRTQADRLLAPEVSDVDGNTEERGSTVSVFNGPPPTVQILKTVEAETAAVSKWIAELAKQGMPPHELGVFVRSVAQLDRARAAVNAAGLSFKTLDDKVETTSGQASISTMHLAKGLEFRAVVVMACDDEVIPLQERIETVADDSDLEEVYNTERHLLYVACTRARDHLLVTSVEPGSEFLDDLRPQDAAPI